MTQINMDFRTQNSREARETFTKGSDHKFKIYRALKAYGKPTHALHLAQLTDLEYSQIQRRLCELVRDGKITSVGKEKIGKNNYTTYQICTLNQ